MAVSGRGGPGGAPERGAPDLTEAAPGRAGPVAGGSYFGAEGRLYGGGAPYNSLDALHVPLPRLASTAPRTQPWPCALHVPGRPADGGACEGAAVGAPASAPVPLVETQTRTRTVAGRRLDGDVGGDGDGGEAGAEGASQHAARARRVAGVLGPSTSSVDAYEPARPPLLPARSPLRPRPPTRPATATATSSHLLQHSSSSPPPSSSSSSSSSSPLPPPLPPPPPPPPADPHPSPPADDEEPSADEPAPGAAMPLLRNRSFGSLANLLDSLQPAPTPTNDLRSIPISSPSAPVALARPRSHSHSHSPSPPPSRSHVPPHAHSHSASSASSTPQPDKPLPVPPDPSAPPPAPAISKRTHALLELLSSERAYASDLALIRDIHIPLALGKEAPFPLPSAPASAAAAAAAATDTPTVIPSSASSRTLSTASSSTAVSSASGAAPAAAAAAPMTPHDAHTIFGNVAELALFSDAFSERLEDALGDVLEGGKGPDHVGEVFIEMIPHMEPPYKTYITHHPTAVAHLNALPQTPALAAYLAHTRTLAASLTHAWDLPSLLIKPVQRLLKYALLLAAVLDDTPDSHPDKPRLRTAKSMIEAVSRAVNEGRRRREVVRDILAAADPAAKKKPAPPVLALPLVLAAAVHIGRVTKGRPPLAPADTDETDAVARLEQRLKAALAYAHALARDALAWASAARALAAQLATWARAFGRALGITPEQASEAFDAFCAVADPQLTALSDALDATLRARLLPPLRALVESAAPPLRLLDALHALAPAHAALLHHSAARGRPPPALLDASQAYVALRGELRTELPKFLRLVDKALAHALQALAGWQARYWADVRDCWAELWDALRVEGERNAGAEETERVWRERWELVEREVAALGIVGAERAPLRARGSGGAGGGGSGGGNDDAAGGGGHSGSSQSHSSGSGNSNSSTTRAGAVASMLNALDPIRPSTASPSSPPPVPPPSSSRDPPRARPYGYGFAPALARAPSSSSSYAHAPAPRRRRSSESLHSIRSARSALSSTRSARTDDSALARPPPLPNSHSHSQPHTPPYPYHHQQQTQTQKQKQKQKQLPPPRRASAPLPLPLRKAPSQGRFAREAEPSPPDRDRDRGRDRDRDRGRLQRAQSLRQNFMDTFRAPRTGSRKARATQAQAQTPAYAPPAYGEPEDDYDYAYADDNPADADADADAAAADDAALITQWRGARALYTCRVVHACAPPPGVAYCGLPFFTLALGAAFDVLKEAGHPSAHRDLPLYVDDGEDCLLLVRERERERERGEGALGWVLASFVYPLE
ncbi:hypothetical protein HETIRDRAFT_456197 [Heterobasidion irregulare TC 32-1]|uniref:DH domain-containing protein n=1 Tax=Heterobasidion irregulare (strain TC 32-1) TaxID=747525 RepID=W4JNH8_HETIT|nr:uncharacterized protein HETIRDRAFT_456197 [Heterobasidion irregulare TC 32-1]ETW74620.1 hypothetical protein HETIRDRAFT_456197 [Heterobasidion irregulare TC 32-1]